MGVLEDEVERLGVLEDDTAARWYQLYAEAVRSYRLAAEQGHAEAQYELGRAYYRRGDQEASDSLRLPEDAAEANRWYRMAAEQGHAKAQVMLGSHSEDDAEAVRWYRMAAEQGLAVAQFNLGQAYQDGKGVLKDDAEAARWFRLAAEQGDVGVQFRLAQLYSGIATASRAEFFAGRTSDLLELAHMWYNIASANSNASLGPVVSEPEDWRLSTDLSGFAERNAGLMEVGSIGV